MSRVFQKGDRVSFRNQNGFFLGRIAAITPMGGKTVGSHGDFYSIAVESWDGGDWPAGNFVVAKAEDLERQNETNA